MEFIKFIRLDIICAFVFLTTIILSALRRHHNVWTSTICWLISAAAVGVVAFFNIGGLFGKLVALLNGVVYPYVFEVTGFSGVEFASFLTAVVIFLAIVIVYLVILGLCYLFGAGGRAKYRKNPSFCYLYRPVSGLIAGIFKGAVFAYLVYFLAAFFVDFRGIDVSNDFVMKFFGNIDPVLKHFKELIHSLVEA